MLDMEITIIKHKKEVEYTTIYNDCINDKRLSAEAMAVLVYAMSKPDDWEIKTKNLSNRFSIGRDKVRNIIKSLCETGYMKRVRRRNQDGSISRVVVYASDKPIFLKEPLTELQEKVVNNITNQQPQPEIQGVVTIECSNKQPGPENQAPVNQALVPYIQNKDCYKKNENDNLGIVNSDQETFTEVTRGCSFVVSFMNRIGKIPGMDIHVDLMERWLEKYGAPYIEEKIKLLECTPGVAFPGKYLVAAVIHNWKKKSSSKNVKTERSMVHSSESLTENNKPSIEYNAAWFRSLPKEGKMRVWEDAIKATPSLAEILKVTNLSVLDAGFEHDAWFKPVVGAFKSYNRIQ